MSDNRKLWIDALRSGEYKQTTSFLKRDDGYSCMGVACEVYQREVGDLVVNVGTRVTSYDYETKILPKKVQNWLGLGYNNGNFYSEALQDFKNLAYLNDNGASFEEIADLIESNPEGLFEEEDRNEC